MAEPRRQRLRFDGADYRVFPNGRCRVEVRLEWLGQDFTAAAEGTQPLEGELRTAAQATIQAASEASSGRMDLDLMGIKTIRAFDVNLVVAAVIARGDGKSYKLLGAKAVAEESPVETACRAVLDALNRVLERYVSDETVS